VPTTQAPHADAKPDPHQDPHSHPHENLDADPHGHPECHADEPGSVVDRPANGNGLAEFHRLEDLLPEFHRLEDLLAQFHGLEVGLAQFHRLEVGLAQFHRLEDLLAQFHGLEDLGNQLTEFECVEVTEPDRSSVAHDRPFGVGVARFPAERRGPGDAGSRVH